MYSYSAFNVYFPLYKPNNPSPLPPTRDGNRSADFFLPVALQLMDATLCDTVGTQTINSRRTRGGGSSVFPQQLTKIMAKLQAPPGAAVAPNGSLADVDSACLAAGGGHAISSAAAAASVSPAELKPLIVLSSDVVPPPPFVPSPCLTQSASTSLSAGSTSTTELMASRYGGRKGPCYSSGAIPFHLNSQNLLARPPTSPPASSVSTPLCATVVSGADGQNRRGYGGQSGSASFQAEQSHLDRVARRRVEAREKRRERREVRMSESLGQIATALELLSSKQDTVIALLQRLADRK